jgi:Domain of unknown function (DUF6531)
VRRFVAGALLLLLIGQSSGAALAATPDSAGRRFDLLAAAVNPVRSAVVNSKLYAVATGTVDRYEAAHAPAPVIQRRNTPLDAVQLMRSRHIVPAHLRQGTRHLVMMPARSELDPHHHRLDPLAMRKSSLTPNAPQPTPSALIEPLRSLLAPSTPRGGHLMTPQRGGIKAMALSNTGTGIEHWWTYEERPIPGIGKAMVNVGTGNYLVSAMDVDIPERGIDLTFRRVYNSQSLHDANGDDGGDPSIFGNRWTSNLDASIILDSVANTITVYDLNGTPCTYTSDGQGHWLPCTGEHATLYPTDQTDCTYAWQKKNGTVYWFHADIAQGGCGIKAAKRGQLQEILGRNQNNNITFTYSYDGHGYTSENVTEIDAVHSDGQKLVMLFGVISGTAINELKEIDRPDGAALKYWYDASGNVLEVDKPGNNSATTVPANPNPNITIPTGDVPETYAYATGTSTMQEACGPRCTVGMWNNPNNPKDGAGMLFTADGSNRLTAWQLNGKMNFAPDDGTTTVLQSGVSTSYQTWYLANFVYGAGSACSHAGSGTTTMCDTDGHSTVWTIDGSNRVTQAQEFTGGSTAIVTQEVWDGNNNLIQTIDANSYVTKYGYDTGSSNQGGNLVEMQLPQVGDVGGQLSPLSFYSYDPYNNVTAYCDPVFNQTNGNSWTNSPTDSLCPSNTGAARFTFNSSDLNEPYGCLTTMKKPSGYTTTISYPSAPAACGYGLPTQTTGTTISQYDNTTRTPTQDFGYDGYGNLNSYDKGKDDQNRYQDSWTLGYDAENQLQQRTENDSTIPLSGSSFSCYYPDGTLLYTETPSQHDADGNLSCPTTSRLLQGGYTPPSRANAYYYDLDGDQVEITTHKGCSTNDTCPGLVTNTVCNSSESMNPIGTTCKYYDGMDRLVETIEPYDTRTFSPITLATREFYSFRWMNRYLYDLSQSGGTANLQIADNTGTVSGLVAYGNLYKTQEYLPQTKIQVYGQSVGPAGWYDLRGTSFDKIDRPVSKYELAYGTTAVTTNSYDCTGQLDLLCSTTNALGQTTSYNYDAIRRVNQVTFSGTSPLAANRTYTFDADGRTASAQNTMGTLTYAYDVDGNELSVKEPSGESASSLICYSYYGDGLRNHLSIGIAGTDSCGTIPQRSNPSNGGISQPNIFSYSYRNDGLLKSQQVNWLGINWGNGTPTFTWTYSPSERETSETDPLYNQSVSIPPGGGGNTTIGTKTYSYDQYGRVSQLTFPEGFQHSTYVYDYDDELVAYNVGGQGGETRNLTLNARGELLQDIFANSIFGYAQGWTQSANGAQVGNGNNEGGETPPNVQAPPTTLQFDSRTSMVTCGTNPQWAQGLTGAENYIYDAAGRQTAAGPSPVGQGCISSNATFSTTYDAENHIAQTNNPQFLTFVQGPPPSSGTIQWGPDGRYRTDSLTGGGGQNDTAHWDGATLLFATGLGFAQLYIGKLGVMDSSGNISISDRDQTGTQLTNHAYTSTAPPAGGHNWFRGLGGGTVRTVAKTGNQYSFYVSVGSCDYYNNNNHMTYSCPLYSPTYPMTRSDGYQMVGGLVQGVRTYDPTSGQWLTPDAYAGDVHDPMSQKPFMWNDNNPVEYEDPSGYCPANPVACVIAAGGSILEAAGSSAAGTGIVAAGATGAAVAGLAGIFVLGTTAPVGGSLSVQDKERMLPKRGDVAYVPPRSKGGDIPRDRQGGFVDRGGNSWRWDGKKGEWDVQHPDGSHTNVGPDGKVTHGPNNFPKGSRNNPRKSSGGNPQQAP